MLPNFIIIGAAKAGTTSLWNYVDAHPDVFVPPIKDLHFYVEEGNWRRGIDWYERQFKGAEGHTGIGEASLNSTMFPIQRGVPERMAAVIPDARLIYLVRDPITRLRSYYLFRVHGGRETLPAERALREHPIYVDSTRYMFQLDQYLPHYPAERILVVPSEDLRNRREETMARVYGFLGVDPTFTSPAFEEEHLVKEERRVRRPAVAGVMKALRLKEIRHRIPTSIRDPLRRLTYRPPPAVSAEISSELEAELRERLAPDVARLREFTGLALEGWSL